MAELADAPDSKSGGGDTSCGFESHLRHNESPELIRAFLDYAFPRVLIYYVYVLRSLKYRNLYIGQTKNIDSRLRAHNGGKVRFTKSRRPLKLVYWEKVNTREETLKKELQWKTTSGRSYLKKKIKLDKE